MVIPKYMPKLAGYNLYLKETGKENYTLISSIPELVEQSKNYIKILRTENKKPGKLEKKTSEFSKL